MRFFKSSLIIDACKLFVNAFCTRKILSTEKIFLWINIVSKIVFWRYEWGKLWIDPRNCGWFVDNFVEFGSLGKLSFGWKTEQCGKSWTVSVCWHLSRFVLQRLCCPQDRGASDKSRQIIRERTHFFPSGAAILYLTKRGRRRGSGVRPAGRSLSGRVDGRLHRICLCGKCAS